MAMCTSVFLDALVPEMNAVAFAMSHLLALGFSAIWYSRQLCDAVELSVRAGDTILCVGLVSPCLDKYLFADVFSGHWFDCSLYSDLAGALG